MPSYSQGTSSRQEFWIPSLDGIRALAFGSVFVAHAGNNGMGGGIGVTVFFFLSGFLITTLLRRENDQFGRISLRGFYIRRIFRIFPPMYLTIAFVLILSMSNFLRNSLNWGFFIAASTFTTNYYYIFSDTLSPSWIGNRGLHPFWSLAVEEHFYLLFPLLFLTMNHVRMSYKKQAGLLAVVCAAVLVWRLCLTYSLSSLAGYNNHILTGTDTRIDSILFGCIMALAANPVLDKNIRPLRGLTVAGGILLLASFAFKNPFYRDTFHYTVQGIALMPLFICTICKSDTWFKWLNARWIRYIGTLSYTLYLVHASLLFGASDYFHPHILAVCAGGVGSLVYAFLMNVLVEEPLKKWRKRFSKRTSNVENPIALSATE
jgi:peptidoglycan/LPS O-acetylase OafA/YrhL